MEERERRVLEKHRKVLVSDIADVEPILDHLVSAGVLRANDDMVQLVRSGATPLMRARKLLDILPSRGGTAFRHFVDALQSVRRSHLAEVLELSLAEVVNNPAACRDETDFSHSPPSHPTACKLQEALRMFHRRKARRCQLFDFQSSGESVGLDEVFVTLSTLNFREVQSMFSERKRLSAERIRELASKTWSERRENVEEITDLKRLLQLSDGKQADGTLLLAQAAGGKTLTLLKIASLWAEGREEFLEQFEFVFYVSGRDEDALKGTSAIDVLRLDQFDLAGSEQEEMAKYLSENSDKVLVLLDGADEGGDLWMKSKGLEKIFQRKGALRKSSFVVSSRPCEAAYRLIPMCDQHFHLVGLNDQHLEELLVRRLGEVDGRALAGELKLAKWSQLRALMKETPMIANMVAALRTEGQPLPSTRTELYTVMVVNMVRRATAKSITGSLAANTLDDLPTEENTALLNIGQLALNGLKRRRYVFDLKKEVRSACGDTVECLGFLEEFRTVSVRGERHEVQFCHLTYQEYLAAYFVSQSSNVENELHGCLKAIGIDDETIPFWRFVGGLLGREKVKALMSFLSGSEAAGAKDWRSTEKHLLFQMSCFAEAMEQPCLDDQGEEQTTRNVAEAAEAFLPEKVDLSNTFLSLSEIHALAVSLAHSSHVVALNQSYSNLNGEHFQVLCSYGGVQHLHSLSVWGNRGLHGSGLTILAEALGRNGQLQYFNADHCKLDIDDCAALKHILITNKNLSTLCLSGNALSSLALRLLQPALSGSQLAHFFLRKTTLDAEGARVIGEVLSANSYLQTLHVHENSLGNDGAASVLAGAKGAKSLGKLALDRIGVDDDVMPSLAAAIQERAFATDDLRSGHPGTVPMVVTIHGNNISEMALRRLCGQMPRNSADQIECGMHIIRNGEIRQRDLSENFTKYTQKGGEGELDLSCMGINADGVAQITAQLDRCLVEVLDLGFNSIDDDSTALLAESFGSNSSLRGLSLDNNHIGNRGLAELSKVLVHRNTSLQWLELCFNPLFVDNNGFSAMVSRHHLGEILAQAVSLKYLGLGSTGVGDEECRVIAAALATNTGSITFIDLDKNKISDGGAAILSSGLEQNTTVRLLDVSCNEIGEDGAVAMSRCVQARERKQCRLHRVWMGGNKVDDHQLVGCMVNAAFQYWNIFDAMATYLE